MKKFLWALGVSALVAFAPVGASPQAAPMPAARAFPAYQPRPALWLVRDQDTEIVLFGTMHSLPADFAWRTPMLDKIIASFDEVFFESRREERLSSEPVLDRTMRKVFHYNRPPLLDRVSPRHREPLREALKKRGMPLFFVDGLPSWFTAFNIGPDDPYGPSMSAKYGVETTLEAAFRARKAPVYSLEDGGELFLTLSNVDPRAQDRMLDISVAEIVSGSAGPVDANGLGPAAALRHDWVTGAESIARVDGYRRKLGPELYKVLLIDRNSAWSAIITERMSKPGKVMIAVGAAHLAGPDSLLTMLARRGITVQRIQ